MNEDQANLLRLVPTDGSSVGNSKLRGQLQWEWPRYWEVRNSLIDLNRLAKGRGRGGSVLLVEQAAEPVQTEETREISLYDSLQTVLNTEWSRENLLQNWLVRITAQQGRRDTGGKWSRPDLLVVTKTQFPYIPNFQFDVISFEVKRAESLDVTVIYEALAHLRAATKAYALLHVPEDRADELSESLAEILDEAKKYGVGVIFFSDPKNFETWEEKIAPIRQEPDPRRLNDFLRNCLDDAARQQISLWCR